MTQRIPRGMPIHTWVDRLIAEAQERGEFDNLPGSGKPLPGIDQPVDEDWWVKQKIREEEVPPGALLPPALALRKEVRGLPETVRDLPDEESVRAAVAEVNQRVADWIRAPEGPVLPVGPALVEDIIAQWRAARQERAAAATFPDHLAQSPAQPEKHDDAAEPPKQQPSPRRRSWWRRRG